MVIIHGMLRKSPNLKNFFFTPTGIFIPLPSIEALSHELLSILYRFSKLIQNMLIYYRIFPAFLLQISLLTKLS